MGFHTDRCHIGGKAQRKRERVGERDKEKEREREKKKAREREREKAREREGSSIKTQTIRRQIIMINCEDTLITF